MTVIYERKTYIPEKGLHVSTISHSHDIGMDRCAETMVFAGNEEGPTSFEDLYFEGHGYETDSNVLDKAHERIVEEQKK